MTRVMSVTTRSLVVLHHAFLWRYQDFLVRYKKRTGFELLTVCTGRSMADQDKAFRSGASKARPGESWHQYGLAADAVPVMEGKLAWNTHDPVTKKLLPEWIAYGEVAKECGLEWAGEWKSFVEFDHTQFSGGLTIKNVMQNPALLDTLK